MGASIKCSVIIPIYRQIPLEFEMISLKQCCKILADYQMIIITYETLNLAEYIKIFGEQKIKYKIEYFPEKYFDGIDGYNTLMFSDKFYKRFLDYEYILIYQLDAYVFSPDLDYWLKQSYDYIGGPTFNEIRHTLKLKWTGHFNGGFCIRRTHTFYHLSSMKLIKFNKYSWELSLKSKKQKILFIKIYLKSLQKIMNIVLKLLHIEISSEDYVWSNVIKQKGEIPLFETALNFSFDSHPEHAMELSGKLPFGCHGWDFYYSYKFWKKYIE
jgi:hypothetical protein